MSNLHASARFLNMTQEQVTAQSIQDQIDSEADVQSQAANTLAPHASAGVTWGAANWDSQRLTPAQYHAAQAHQIDSEQRREREER